MKIYIKAIHIIFLLVIINSCSLIGENTERKKKPDYSKFENELIQSGFIDIQTLDPDIKVDLKYSCSDNFLGKVIYKDIRCCFLRREAAVMLIKAQKYLKEIYPGYSLIIYDGLRPRRYQYIMWNFVKGSEKQIYVANPKGGSIHNYGLAVDLNIVDDKGNELDMGTPFDSFSKLSEPKHEDFYFRNGRLTVIQLENRRLLRRVMIKAGFQASAIEWWHFDAIPIGIIKKKYSIVE